MSAGELLRRKVHPHPQSRTHRPYTDLQSAALAYGAHGLRPALQQSTPTPRPRTSPSTTDPPRGRPQRRTDQASTGSWRIDQRVRTGSMKLLISTGGRILEPHTPPEAAAIPTCDSETPAVAVLRHTASHSPHDHDRERHTNKHRQNSAEHRRARTTHHTPVQSTSATVTACTLVKRRLSAQQVACVLVAGLAAGTRNPAERSLATSSHVPQQISMHVVVPVIRAPIGVACDGASATRAPSPPRAQRVGAELAIRGGDVRHRWTVGWPTVLA
jgi:hypothetical protein